MTPDLKASGFKKIAEPEKPCLHPEHRPPGNIVLRPGTYEYTCPGCRKRTVLEVPYVYS